MKDFLKPPTFGGLVWSVTLTTTIMLLGLFVLNRVATAAPRMGNWARADGVVMQVACPSASEQADAGLTVRLPVGCEVSHPRVGYTVDQDLKLREELPALRAQVPVLRAEVDASRAAADSMRLDLTSLLAEERAKADEQRRLRQDAELLLSEAGTRLKVVASERWSYAGLGLLVGGVLGAVAIGGVWLGVSVD